MGRGAHGNDTRREDGGPGGGLSLVEAAGMPERVTGSLEEYTRLVQALARCRDDGDQV